MSPNLPSIDELDAVAQEAADAAARVTLAWFRQRDLGLDNKASAGFDPVTRADREAELAIRQVIAARRPQDGILGEEHDDTATRSGLTWVIDPIDGTRGFVSGTPTWGTLISVGTDDGPILGLIDQPYTGERFIGAGSAARLLHRGQSLPLAVRPAPSLDQATLFSTFPEIGTPDERNAFQRVAEKVRLTRYGMDCYAYALLAAGQVDLVIEAGLHSYDIHAPAALIAAAGGIVTTWDGAPAHRGGNILAAASPALHRQAMELLAG